MVWCQVDCYYVLCIVFVNKMDKIGVDFFNCVDMIKDCIGVILVLIQFLIGVESVFEGYVDLIIMKEWVWVGEDLGVIWEVCEICDDLKVKVEEMCVELVEMVVEVDEVVMEVYLEGEELFEEKLCELICKGMLEMVFVLVICGFVFKNKGVQLMFNVVIDYLLSLLDVLVYMGFKLGDESEECNIVCFVDDVQLFVGFVFKIMNDFFVGLFIFVCIYLGVMIKGGLMLNFIKDK